MSPVALTNRTAARRRRVDARGLALWTAFLKAHACVSAALNRDLEEERGMPLGWYAVLVTLASSPTGRVRMQELAGSVLLSVSGLTRLFDRMEQAGLVRRRPCVSDKRGTYALLTAAGRRAFRRAAPVHMWGIHDYFAAHITVAEAAAMESALRKVIEAVDPHAA